MVQSEKNLPLSGSLVLADAHEPEHFATETNPTLSLVIFDRDGTLIEGTGFPIYAETISWQKGALEAITWLR